MSRTRLATVAGLSVEEAPDDLELGVVVGRGRIVIEVEPRIPDDSLPEPRILRIAQTLQVEDREPLAVMEPVEHDGELFVVHSLTRKGHVDGAGFGVLSEVPLPGFLEASEDRGVAAARIEHGPVVDVFDGIVRPVVAAPTYDALEITPVVEVTVEELQAGAVVARTARARAAPSSAEPWGSQS